MKKIFIFTVLMALANLAYAQVSAHQKTTSTVLNNQSSGQAGNAGNTPNAPNGIFNAPQKTGITTPGAVPQGNAAVNPKTNISPQTSNNSQGHTVCRTSGSIVYYCN